MSEPLKQLPASEQKRVLAALRGIMSEPDPEASRTRREELAEELRPKHPEVADWILSDTTAANGDEPVVADEFPVDEERARKLKGKTILVKYGGNAMVDDNAKQQVISDICTLKSLGIRPVLVHGGGPAISDLLGKVGVKSRFIGGHRKTDPSVMGYVEMALSGKVNSEIVKLIGFNGYRSVGISGKDGGMVTAEKRIHKVRQGRNVRRSDLGQVGDVKSINTDLVLALLDKDYIPVIAPIGVGDDLQDYNINADMFAGHMAAALGADAYLVLTDVAGIFVDKDDPDTLIPEFSAHAAREEIGRIVQGGMIPKVESMLIALEGGVPRAHILDGMRKYAILEVLLSDKVSGTTIKRTKPKKAHD